MGARGPWGGVPVPYLGQRAEDGVANAAEPAVTRQRRALQLHWAGVLRRGGRHLRLDGDGSTGGWSWEGARDEPRGGGPYGDTWTPIWDGLEGNMGPKGPLSPPWNGLGDPYGPKGPPSPPWDGLGDPYGPKGILLSPLDWAGGHIWGPRDPHLPSGMGWRTHMGPRGRPFPPLGWVGGPIWAQGDPHLPPGLGWGTHMGPKGPPAPPWDGLEISMGWRVYMRLERPQSFFWGGLGGGGWLGGAGGGPMQVAGPPSPTPVPGARGWRSGGCRRSGAAGWRCRRSPSCSPAPRPPPPSSCPCAGRGGFACSGEGGYGPGGLPGHGLAPGTPRGHLVPGAHDVHGGPEHQVRDALIVLPAVLEEGDLEGAGVSPVPVAPGIVPAPATPPSTHQFPDGGG